MEDSPFILSPAQTYEYLEGKCHLLAFVIHDTTALPIFAVHDHDDTDRVIHVFVVHRGTDVIDVNGRHSLQEYMERVEEHQCCEVELWEHTRGSVQDMMAQGLLTEPNAEDWDAAERAARRILAAVAL